MLPLHIFPSLRAFALLVMTISIKHFDRLVRGVASRYSITMNIRKSILTSISETVSERLGCVF